jgi:hypothetical protein
MEAKINITEILKDKPQGTKLYDLLYNVDVSLDTISTTDTETVVWCTNETDNNTTCHRGYSEFGTVRGCPDGLQILLPSKEMRDWSKFAWKKGDILVSNDSDSHIIFNGFSKDDYTTFEGKHWISVSKKRHISCLDTQNTQNYHIEDNKEAAQTYINTIEERLGGKINLETLEIEKQTEFKDGDIVVYGKSVAICRKIYKHTLYFYISIDETFGLLFNDNCVSAEGYRFATDSEKQQLFEALAKENKAWDAEKKAIVDLKPKCEFKPFDRCIWKIRNCEGSIWQASFVSYVDEYGATPMGTSKDEDLVNLIILPYKDQTKLLVGTTDEWKGDK